MGGGSTDAQVVAQGKSSPNAIKFDTTYPDVVRYNDVYLLAGGTAAFSADFYVGINDNFVMSFWLGSGNPTNNGIYYGSRIAQILVGYGDASVHIWESDTGYFPLLKDVILNAWHSLTISINKTGVTSGSADIYIDSELVADNYSFTELTDANGFNAIELYSANNGYQGASGSGDGFLVDNISLTGSTAAVSEPATMLLLGSGLIGPDGARRKFKK